MRPSYGFVLLVAAAPFWAQTPEPADGARGMYYYGAREKKDTLPPIRPTTPGHSNSGTIAKPGTPEAAVMHLGLRYTLLSVNPKSNRVEPVDSARTFKKGDCLALELEANRSSYLYVMAKQSDGNWEPFEEESTVLDPGVKVRAPKDGCFDIKDPPGTETLVVVLSRDPRDFIQLYAGIKGSPDRPGQRPEPKPADGATQVADAGRVNSAVEQMANQYGGTRNLSVRRVPQPQNPKETPHSVYVVNASARPSSTLVTRIEIHHR